MREMQEMTVLLTAIGKSLDELQGQLNGSIAFAVIIPGSIKKLTGELKKAILQLSKLEDAKQNLAEISRYRLTLKTYCTLLHATLKNSKDGKYYDDYLYSTHGQAILAFVNSPDPEIKEEEQYKDPVAPPTAVTPAQQNQNALPLVINQNSSSTYLSILGFFGNTTSAVVSTLLTGAAALIGATLIAGRSDISPRNKFLFFGLIAGIFCSTKYGINTYLNEPEDSHKNFRKR